MRIAQTVPTARGRVGGIYTMLRAAGWEEPLHSVRSPRRAPNRRGDLPSGPGAGATSFLLFPFFFVEICKVLGGLAATEPLPPARTEQVKRDLIGDRSLTTMC